MLRKIFVVSATQVIPIHVRNTSSVIVVVAMVVAEGVCGWDPMTIIQRVAHRITMIQSTHNVCHLVFRRAE